MLLSNALNMKALHSRHVFAGYANVSVQNVDLYKEGIVQLIFCPASWFESVAVFQNQSHFILNAVEAFRCHHALTLNFVFAGSVQVLG